MSQNLEQRTHSQPIDRRLLKKPQDYLIVAASSFLMMGTRPWWDESYAHLSTSQKIVYTGLATAILPAGIKIADYVFYSKR